ncbi:MAG: DUF3857 domain-containing protein [Holophagales bacterium]|nr:DUF3857 domain-containing protein [Holophagales bacterium]
MKVNSSLAINRDFGESRIVWDPSVETFEVLYNRTVLPSGEVVPGPANAIVDELPPGVHRNPLWSKLRRKVIVHTALEPGAVIEASWRVTRAASTPAGMTVAEPLAFAFPVAQRTVEVEAPRRRARRLGPSPRADRRQVHDHGSQPHVPLEARERCRASRGARHARARGVRAVRARCGGISRGKGLGRGRAPAALGRGRTGARRRDRSGPQGGRLRAGSRARPPRGADGPLRRHQRLGRAPRVAHGLGHPPARLRLGGGVGVAARDGGAPGARPRQSRLRRPSRPPPGRPASRPGPGFRAPRPGRPAGAVRRGRRSPLRPGRAEGRDASGTPPRPCPPRRPGRLRRSRRARRAVAAPSRGFAEDRRERRRQG